MEIWIILLSYGRVTVDGSKAGLYAAVQRLRDDRVKVSFMLTVPSARLDASGVRGVAKEVVQRLRCRPARVARPDTLTARSTAR
jgi:hypothetical protein